MKDDRAVLLAEVRMLRVLVEVAGLLFAAVVVALILAAWLLLLP